MVKQILMCSKCKKFTLQDTCPECDNKTLSPAPAKYSPQDKYAKYRRKAKFDKKSKIKTNI